MDEVLLSSAYLAPVEYYAWLLAAKRVRVEAFDNYVKQTYRNRCVIAAADGPLSLSIPTEKAPSPKCLMRDVRISDHGNWRHLHWNAIHSAYKNSPFFEYYEDDFRPFYEQKFAFLYDFNAQLCQLVCALIDMQPNIEPTQCYLLPESDEVKGVLDLREVIHPKRHAREADPLFSPLPYYQVFRQKHGFLPNLSIVDLLFNMGPESLLVLRDAIAE